MAFIRKGLRRPTSAQTRFALAMFNKPYNDLSQDEKRKVQLRMREPTLSLDELRKLAPFMFED